MTEVKIQPQAELKFTVLPYPQKVIEILTLNGRINRLHEFQPPPPKPEDRQYIEPHSAGELEFYEIAANNLKKCLQEAHDRNSKENLMDMATSLFVRGLINSIQYIDITDTYLNNLTLQGQTF